MRLPDIAFANIPTGATGSPLGGTGRLLRDLVCVGLTLEDRPSAGERLETTLGRDLAASARASVLGRSPARGLHPRRAA